MVDSEAGEMQSDTWAAGLDDVKVEEFTGEEQRPSPPPTPMEDMLVQMEETDEKLFFSDQDDAFPSFADFSCLSFPSVSPSLPKPSSTTFSETDAMQPPELPPPPPPPADNDDAGFDIVCDEIDLWETCTEEPIDSKWDPSSSFSGETAAEEKVGFLCGGDQVEGDYCSSEDLAGVFLDWLKRNKDSISPEDLKSIKLKRSTIECAARRLGPGKQSRVHLLKLILAWVQNHHLQKRRRRTHNTEEASDAVHFTHELATTNYNPNIDHFYYDAVPCNSWMPYTGGSSIPPVMPGEALPPQPFYQDQVFSAEPWQQGLSPAVHYTPSAAQYLPVYFPGSMSSATKEARKKRMARHRRTSSLHHHRISQQQQHNQPRQSSDMAVVVEESSSAHSNVEKDNSSNWPFLSSSPAAAVEERRQDDAQEGIKADKNYRFLLQKVLKQSDVGSLGRIVLPKKEAEINLPELDARDGISIEMEDIGTSRVWNMRYRFWPNNKSRMYLLENTGDFVRSNGLQEGDFIVIYSDVNCGKYMIRGVKVRQPVDMTKNSGKARQKKEKSSRSTMAVSQLLDDKGKSPYDLEN